MSGRNYLGLAGMLGIATVLFGAPARASEIRWNAPPSCADREGVVDQVERLLGRDLKSVDHLDFAVEISEQESGWRLRLDTFERGAEMPRSREIEGRSCAEVLDAASIAIAMTIRAGAENAPPVEPAAEEPPESTPNPAPAPAAQRTPEAKAKPVELPAPKPAPAELRPTLGLFGVGDFGALPSPAPGAELAASLGWRSLRGSVLGSFFAPQRSDALDDGSGGQFSLVLAALLLCAERPTSMLRPIGCVGFEIGRLSGEGYGVARPRIGSSLWEGLRADAGLSFAFAPPIAAMVRGGVSVPLERQEFVLNGSEFVHRPSSLTGRLLLGLEVDL